jgi:hypothetical protein
VTQNQTAIDPFDLLQLDIGSSNNTVTQPPMSGMGNIFDGISFGNQPTIPIQTNFNQNQLASGGLDNLLGNDFFGNTQPSTTAVNLNN